MDIVNYQLYGYPVMMYGMMLVTIGALTFATVGGAEAVGLSSVGNMLPSLPSASPEASAAPAVFGAPPTPEQSAPPASTTPVAEPVNQTQPAMSQGGKRKRNGSKRSEPKRSGSKRSGSKKNRTKKNVSKRSGSKKT